MRLLVTTLSLIPSIILAAPQLDDSFKNLENKYDGKIGIYTLNTDDKLTSNITKAITSLFVVFSSFY